MGSEMCIRDRLQAAVIVGVLILALVIVAIDKFQAALHEVIELRRIFGEAVYKDCCDVSYY